MADKRLDEFEKLFRAHFKPLCGFAMKYVKDLDDAKEVVHDVFVIVWGKFDDLGADVNYKSYLYTAVKNRCLNFIRSRSKLVKFDKVVEETLISETHDALETSELEREIEMAIDTLPDKCRQVFKLSRFEGLKYAEIAKKMDISVKTVESQMSKALRILKKHLAPFLSLILFMWDK